MISLLVSSIFILQTIKGQPVEPEPVKSLNSQSPGEDTYVFTYKDNATPSYAQSNAKPTTTSLYGSAYSDVKHLLGSISTTTWGSWDPTHQLLKWLLIWMIHMVNMHGHKCGKMRISKISQILLYIAPPWNQHRCQLNR